MRAGPLPGPQGYWKTTTFVAALRFGGMFAPRVIDGAHSPDLNPIEPVFSTIKNELRRRELRTIRALENAFGEALDWITPTDARGYFSHAGH